MVESFGVVDASLGVNFVVVWVGEVLVDGDVPFEDHLLQVLLGWLLGWLFGSEGLVLGLVLLLGGREVLTPCLLGLSLGFLIALIVIELDLLGRLCIFGGRFVDLPSPGPCLGLLVLLDGFVLLVFGLGRTAACGFFGWHNPACIF